MSQFSSTTTSANEKVVVVVGSLNTDLVVTLDTFPAAGETVLGSSFEQTVGGKGLNQAIAAARLGSTVAMIGAIGQDQFGVALAEMLDSEDIESFVTKLPNSSTGMAIIEVESSGENRIVVISGANDLLTAESVEAQN